MTWSYIQKILGNQQQQQNQLEPISEFSKVVEYKVTFKKLFIFTSNEQSWKWNIKGSVRERKDKAQPGIQYL